MVHSLTLISPTSFSFSFQYSPSSAFRYHHPVVVTGNTDRRPLICAAAVAEAPPLLERRSTRPASLYDVLRVDENASVKEIKAAYRNLAKLYHPDAVTLPEESSNGRKFIEIHDAYVTLSDPAARELYDLKLTVGSRRRGEIRMKGSTRRWETDQCW